jgi:hypothetical protein
MWRSLLIAALFSTCAFNTMAAPNGRTITVSIDATTSSESARQITFYLREKFRSSALFKLAEQGQSAGFYLHIVTINGDGGLSNLTMYSVALTTRDLRSAFRDPSSTLEYYMTNIVGYCGAQVTASCATRIYEGLAPDIEQYSDALNTVLRQSVEENK